MKKELINTIRGGEFLISDQEIETVFVPEEASEEQEMMRQAVVDFVRQEVQKKGHLLENQVELIDKSAELGLLGAHIPEEYGGMGLDANTITIILDELGRAGGSFDTSFAAHTGIGMLPILYFGTEEQKNKYLPKLCSGELKAAYCLTEPGSGSDALAAKTKAILDDKQENYILEGQKMWISNAGFADIFIVFAQVGGDKFTGFIVEADSPNIKLGEEEHKMGITGSSTRQVFFEGTPVPVNNVLGEIGKGHLIAFNVLNIGRFKLGILTCGGSKEIIDIAVRYALDREQFGQAIAHFGAMKYKIAEMALKTFQLESAVYRLSDMIHDLQIELTSSGVSEEEALRESAEEYAIECAILKIAGSETIDYCADELVQIHGGYGFSEEYPASRIYRDARINRIYEGTNEINRLLIVNMLLKKAMKGTLNIVDPAWAVQKELTQMPSFIKPDGDFGRAETAIKNFKKVALLVAGAAAKYQMDGKINLEKEQEIVMNVSDILIELFLSESLFLRVKKLNDLGLEKDNLPYNSLLKLTLHEAQARIRKIAIDALASFSEGDEKKVMILGLNKFLNYPHINVKESRRDIADYMIENGGYRV